MTGFDYVVLIIIGVGAIGGFFRGFVAEVLALAAWGLALLAIHWFHEPLTGQLSQYLPTETGAGILGFALLMLLPYAATKLIASQMGSVTRNSLLGPVDRLLGFGFGGIKGMIVTVLGFSVMVFGYDVVWGEAGRPTWISQARVYPMLNAASEEAVALIAERRSAAKTATKRHKRASPDTDNSTP
jgi:membrane protein required for colicin V production